MVEMIKLNTKVANAIFQLNMKNIATIKPYLAILKSQVIGNQFGNKFSPIPFHETLL